MCIEVCLGVWIEEPGMCIEVCLGVWIEEQRYVHQGAKEMCIAKDMCIQEHMY